MALEYPALGVSHKITPLRDEWDVEPSDLPPDSYISMSLDPQPAPLITIQALTVYEKNKLSMPLNGAVTDMAFNAQYYLGSNG